MSEGRLGKGEGRDREASGVMQIPRQERWSVQLSPEQENPILCQVGRGHLDQRKKNVSYFLASDSEPRGGLEHI